LDFQVLWRHARGLLSGYTFPNLILESRTVARPTPPHGTSRGNGVTRRAQEAVQVALDRRDNGGDAAEQRFASPPAGNDHSSPTRATA